MNRILFTICLMIFSSLALAAGSGYNTSLGGAANNVNEILLGVSSIIIAVIYIAGAAVLCSAAMKYRIHRQNPQQVHISTVITEIVLGIILLGLPTVTKMANEHLFSEDSPIQTQGAGSRAVSEPSRSRATQPTPVAPTRR